MKLASIDIGTNTLRLLIAEPDETSHGMRPLGVKRIITRLGGGFTAEAGIAPDSAERTIEALSEFCAHIEKHNVKKVTAIGTSAVRDAKNRDWFLGEVEKRTGLKVTVVSGAEEARLSVFGVLFVLDDRWAIDKKRLVFDIGGGSTEFMVTKGVELLGAWSTEMGVVRLSETYLVKDPPTPEELKALREEIAKGVVELKSSMAEAGFDPAAYSIRTGAELVGTAGTITTLAAIDLKLEKYNPKRINNHVLTKRSVSDALEHLSSLPLKERSEVLSLDKGREDLIIPGAMIALEVMEAFDLSYIKVSDGGLLEGAMLKQIWEGSPIGGAAGGRSQGNGVN